MYLKRKRNFQIYLDLGLKFDDIPRQRDVLMNLLKQDFEKERNMYSYWLEQAIDAGIFFTFLLKKTRILLLQSNPKMCLHRNAYWQCFLIDCTRK